MPVLKILVLGANGQVGSELRLALKNLSRVDGLRPQITFSDRSTLDIGHLQAISTYLDSVAPDIIVNAAAYTAVDQAEAQQDLAFLVNEAAVKELAIYCQKQMSYLVHISTDYVFDGQSDRPYAESDAVGPSCVYGHSKLAGERIIREVLEEHIILRTSWVFGAKGGNFVKTMLRLASEGKQLSVVADQYGAPTSARAIAETVVAIIARLHSEPDLDQFWGTYHYSGAPFVSWAEFAKEIFKQAADRGLMSLPPAVNDISTADYPTPAARPANSRLDCSKLKTTFGIEPDDWKISLGWVLDELKEGMQN